MTWVYGGILAAVFACGVGMGLKIEEAKVDHLVLQATQDALAQAKRVNDDNAKLKAMVDVMTERNQKLESDLGNALQNVRVETRDRVIWREREAKNPDCAAWLAAPVLCRLHPSTPDGTGKASPHPGPHS